MNDIEILDALQAKLRARIGSIVREEGDVYLHKALLKIDVREINDITEKITRKIKP